MYRPGHRLVRDVAPAITSTDRVDLDVFFAAGPSADLSWVTSTTIGYELGVTDHNDVRAVPADDEVVDKFPAVDQAKASQRHHEAHGRSAPPQVDPMAPGRSVDDDNTDAVEPNEPA
jgi:hypothetical protein